MASANSQLSLLLILPILLNGCANLPPNYAPVTTNTPDVVKDETKYHQVKKGDTLYAISLLYDLDYRQLAQWNKIAPPYTIEIGQKIKLSGPDLENKSAQDSAEQLSPPTRMDSAKQKIAAAKPTNRVGSQKSPPVSLNNKSSVAYRPSDKTDRSKNTAEKNDIGLQKKSIISIDNTNMLKLSFQWPIKGKVLKAFSQADNKGIDIAGKVGQDVKAAEAGKVVYSGQGLIGYGNLLIIKHNDLYLSAYANNSRLLVAEGENVAKGEVIAKASQAETNQATLHFEIRKNGKPVNPLSLLPER